MGLLQLIAEKDRQRAANDSKFLKSLLYYFELQVPKNIAPQAATSKFLFPLILPPESMTVSEPYAIDKSFGLDGGLFVEEQGIIARNFSISGTTGWAPKRMKRPVSDFNAIGFPKNRSFYRDTTRKSSLIMALSGQRHFQFLQDAVFRTYGDLKQDPATSKGTRLYFHNAQDDEHWRIFPESFTTTRDKDNPLTYRYEIAFIGVADKAQSEVTFSEDKPVFSNLRDTFLVLRTAVTMIRAGLQDLGKVEGELRAVNGKFVSLLDGAAGIADDTANLVEGAATLIATPFSIVENTVKAGLDALLEWNTGVEDSTAVGPPANLLNSIRRIVDALVMIGCYPSQFQNSIQAAVDRFQKRQALATSHSTASLAQAGSSDPPSSIRGFARVGTGLLPGDLARSRDDLGLGRFVPKFTSAVEYVVEAGDSLAALAGRYLGDARAWRYIAIFNDLQAPYISSDGLPGTLDIGDRILIPSFGTPIAAQESPATYGVKSDEPAAVQALGRDYRLEAVDSMQFDLVIDEAGGAVDFLTTEGISNLAQGLRTRINTERATDLLYKNLGTERVVGLGLSEVDFETAQLRLVDAVQADPRIAGVKSVAFDNSQPDVLEASITAEVRGFTRPERIPISTPR